MVQVKILQNLLYALDNNLNQLIHAFFTTNDFYDDSFSKCIHLIDNDGIFAYYNFSSTYNISFPYIKIKYYDSTTKGFKDRFSSSIELNYNNIEFNLLFFSIVL